MTKILPIPLLLLLNLTLGAQEGKPLSREERGRVEKEITAVMAKQGIPGLSVAIVSGRKLRFANGYGFSDLENSVPAKAATVYRLASISKPITAVAALQLVEMGKLDLDAPVQKYCPDFPKKKWSLTPRHLLGHLGGIRHYRGILESRSTKHYTSLKRALRIFQDDPLLHEPGTKFRYTTYGYNLLGTVVEGASGMKFPEVLASKIFKPAGMDRARPDDVYAIIPNRAQGYRKWGGRLRNSSLADTSNKIPGGGLCSTVEDLARFAIALQEGRLVKKETLSLMWTPMKLKNGRASRYGMGWVIRKHKGRTEIMHSGGQQRVSTYLYMVPEKGAAVVIMSNLEGAKLLRLARNIFEIFHTAEEY